MYGKNEYGQFPKIFHSGTISLVGLEHYIEMKRKEILNQHTAAVTQLHKGRFKGQFQTFVIESGSSNRKIIRAKTRKDLEDKIIEYYTNDMDASKHTIQHCYEGWIDYLSINRRPSSIQTYRKTYKRHFGGISESFVEDLTTFELKVFLKKEVAEKKLTVKAYANLKTVVLGVFHYAKDNSYISLDIDSALKDLSRQLRGSFHPSKKSEKKDIEIIFTDDEVAKVADYCAKSGTLVDLGILLLFGTGLRVGELAALKKEDIEEDCRAINVSRTEERVGNGAEYIVIDSAKSEAGTRTVLLTQNVADTLNLILRLSDKSKEYLFSDRELDRYPAKKFRDRLYRICDHLAIKRRSPHAIRRTYATMIYEAGVPEYLIVKQMGHIDFEITKAFYIYNRKTRSELIEELEKAI